MLEILIPEQHYEPFDEVREVFLPPVDIKETKLQLEHSLISLKKWEQKFHKRFLDQSEKTLEENKEYIKCMTLNKPVDDRVYDFFTAEQMQMINNYIKDPMTATTIKESNIVSQQRSTREGITAEIIYYWMIVLNIPVEFQKWHLNQLLTLIKVVSLKSTKQKPMDKRTAAMERDRINMERRARFHSKG